MEPGLAQALVVVCVCGAVVAGGGWALAAPGVCDVGAEWRFDGW